MCAEPPPTTAPVSPTPAPTERTPGLVPVKRALISVSNKTSLTALAQVLVEAGVQILSTGGTFRALQEAEIPVTGVSEYTGFPEVMGGRVKTLHPKIHGGLLAVRDDEQHLAAMEEHEIDPIDLVVVNLYPFEQTVAQGKPFGDCVENIDIGGPSMIRAAAKNFKYVTVVTDVTQYTDIIAELEEHSGKTSYELRRRLAAAAFAKMAAYDSAVAAKFVSEIGISFPEKVLISASRKQVLRYGENPHQKAAFYVMNPSSPGVATAEQVQGKELSYNNLSDTDAAFELVSEFVGGDPVCAIIKHANPCGVASGVTAQDAYLRALACDPVSAFGGIVALNVTVDLRVAEEIAKMFIELVIAPDATAEALALLASKKNLRVLLTGSMPDPKSEGLTVKSVSGGVLLQTRDNGSKMADDLTVASKREPTEDEMKNLLFAWKVCKHVKSNAIVYVKDMATVGTGAGQMSRVDASRIAAWKAEEASSNAQEEQSRTVGSVVASDAFFPFADGLVAAAEAGATAVIQPGGSKRDPEVIAAADERGIALVMTGMRHFRH
ncbi:Bifunctional purine biosynthesis protein ATIC [Gracilaria domingensis]|nr:Bifunctional purine biosynthesis protein ATIC [Gracilaria domingensis]